MDKNIKKIQQTYVTLILSSTLASSFIWGVNTLFLLDAGLSNLEAFTANAFFTAGQVLFEIPTGIVADLWGRRLSYLLGAGTLALSTLLYLFMWQTQAPLWQWAIASMTIGLGFTFFSGAIEAWLVDALKFYKFTGSLDSVFAKGQVSMGIAMLTGSVTGGVIAQLTNLGGPFIARVSLLAVTFLVAFFMMKDVGFTPVKNVKPMKQMGSIFRSSIDNGFKNRPVRWLMLAAPFSAGTGIFAFYALQPYLLDLYGNPNAYSIAGLAAAIVAGAQILGGLLVSQIRKQFKKRTTVLISGVLISALVMLLVGLTSSFALAVALLIVWAIVFAATGPIRQAYINGIIPSKERATILSFDSLMGSAGGVFTQPALGRVADVYSYGTSYVVAAGIQVLALPFVVAARREKAKSDKIKN